MSHRRSATPSRNKPPRKASLTIAAALGALLVFAAVALAVGLGLQNQSFEQDLDHWTAKTLNSNRNVVYGPGGGKGPEVPGCDAPDAYGICVVEGPDEFDATDGEGTRTITVSPLDGDKMLRLAGPFYDAFERQAEEHVFHVSQEFMVNASEPIVTMNYNLFTFDYSGFDELRLKITVFDEDGPVVSETVDGASSAGTDLKTTGWQGVEMDLTEYSGEQLSMQLEVEGTSDSFYGTWGYFDAGSAPAPPVDADAAEGSAPAGVIVNKQVDENGHFAFTMANSEVQSALGSEPCMPFLVSFPINSGTSTLSNVTLGLGSQVENMVNTGGDIWEAELCVYPFQGGDLTLEYDATEEGVTEHFIVIVGQIVLIDPQGVVYDRQAFEAAKAAGQSDQQARATAAIVGATVRLQRENPPGSGQFVNILSADPGIAPNVNPQITGADGRYQWDVSAGRYRVVVSKSGYDTVTSMAVDIPPPVLDLHIPMGNPAPSGGGGQGGQGGQSGSGATPSVTPPPAGAPSKPAAGPGSKCAAQAKAAHAKALRKAAKMKKNGQAKGAAALKKQAGKRLAAALKRCKGARG